MPVYRRMSHCVFACDYYLVWPSKYRRKIINSGVQGYPKTFLQSWPEHHPDVIIKEINTDQDHIYLLVSIPPTKSVGYYFVSTVGINEGVIRRYIGSQGKDDAGQNQHRVVLKQITPRAEARGKFNVY